MASCKSLCAFLTDSCASTFLLYIDLSGKELTYFLYSLFIVGQLPGPIKPKLLSGYDSGPPGIKTLSSARLSEALNIGSNFFLNSSSLKFFKKAIPSSDCKNVFL